MIRAIIFDFDGVILESVSVKTEAFRQLFSFSPEHVDEIVQFHLDNGGMSRFDKFVHIYKNILHEELPDDKFRALSDRFSDLVEDAVADAPFVAGTLDFLKKPGKKYDFYIVSATPEEELKRIVKKKKISRFFSGIFGSPAKKVDHILKIITEKNLMPEEVVFIGDAPNDWDAAKKAGVKFIARIKPGDPDRLSNRAGVVGVIRSMRDLEAVIG